MTTARRFQLFIALSVGLLALAFVPGTLVQFNRPDCVTCGANVTFTYWLIFMSALQPVLWAKLGTAKRRGAIWLASSAVGATVYMSLEVLAGRTLSENFAVAGMLGFAANWLALTAAFTWSRALSRQFLTASSKYAESNSVTSPEPDAQRAPQQPAKTVSSDQRAQAEGGIAKGYLPLGIGLVFIAAVAATTVARDRRSDTDAETGIVEGKVARGLPSAPTRQAAVPFDPFKPERLSLFGVTLGQTLNDIERAFPDEWRRAYSKENGYHLVSMANAPLGKPFIFVSAGDSVPNDGRVRRVTVIVANPGGDYFPPKVVAAILEMTWGTPAHFEGAELDRLWVDVERGMAATLRYDDPPDALFSRLLITLSEYSPPKR